MRGVVRRRELGQLGEGLALLALRARERQHHRSAFESPGLRRAEQALRVDTCRAHGRHRPTAALGPGLQEQMSGTEVGAAPPTG